MVFEGGYEEGYELNERLGDSFSRYNIQRGGGGGGGCWG